MTRAPLRDRATGAFGHDSAGTVAALARGHRRHGSVDGRTALPCPSMEIRLDDLRGTAIRELLEEHQRNMHAITPPGSVHALGIDALRRPDITFWTAWSGRDLLGCGALKALSATHGEIKSMRTAGAHRRTGVARALLDHILAEARRRGYARLSLETGAGPEFEPARRLYASVGFETCGPFEGYTDDPNSAFMSMRL